MPSAEVASEVIMSDDVGDGTLMTSVEVACSYEAMPSDEVADEVVFSPDEEASEAMPSAEVASEVITTYAASNGAMMTSCE